VAASNPASADRFDIEQWINFDAIQLLIHHASAVVAAIVIFALVARLAIWLLPHGFVRKIVVIIDDVVLIGLLVYFGWEMFVYLWNRRPPLQRNASLGASFTTVEACLPPPLAKPLGAIARAFARLVAAPW
jgi:small-conductance mechanosensitive channel